MWATKAYILRIDTDISISYSEDAAKSCASVGLPYQYVQGFQNQTGKSAFGSLGIQGLPTEPYKRIDNPSTGHKAMCATAGHMRIWQSIIDGPDEAVVILEHDAIMLQPLTIDIPDNKIVVLGYKVTDPSRYNHKSAGPPNELIDINGHEGAHAYAITRTTARFLIEEITRQGIRSAIDNDYFIRGQRRTAIPLSIASLTPALGWLRKSTIWGASASKNYEFVASFSKNYK